MQPSISVSSSLRDRDSEDSDHMGNDQDSPVVPVLRIPQSVEEAHIVPLPDAEEDDKKLSVSSYDKSDLWPWSKRNTAILADVVDEPPPSSPLPSADEEADPDSAVEVGPSSCISMNLTAETSDNDRASASYLPDMATPSTGSTNDTESTDPPVSIIASEDSGENNDGHERHYESENGIAKGGGGVEGEVPPSPAPSEVPEMPIFPNGMKSSISLERHGSIGSTVARKSSLFKSHRGNNSNNKRSSMPLPSAVIASLLPWRGSRRPSSEPELPSQSSRSRSRLSSSLPSPH